MTSTAFDTYAIRCQLSDQPIDGDLANLSADCKPSSTRSRQHP